MTDNEIIKALEFCSTKNKCNECAFQPYCSKGEILDEYVLDLINRQKAEIEEDNLKIDHQAQIIRTLETALADKMAEIESLKEQPISQDMIKQIQTDILNVFVNKLLEKSRLDRNDGGIYFHDLVVDFDKIISLLKEMTESGE